MNRYPAPVKKRPRQDHPDAAIPGHNPGTMIKHWKIIALIPAVVTFGFVIIVPDSLNLLNMEFLSLSLVIPLIIFMKMESPHFKFRKAYFYLALGMIFPVCYYVTMSVLTPPRHLPAMITAMIASLLGVFFFGVVVLQLFISLLKDFWKK